MESCPVVVGPQMQNFEVLVKELVAAGGVVQVADLSALESQLRAWLTDPEAATMVSKQGLACLQRHAGATRRTLEKLLEFALEEA